MILPIRVYGDSVLRTPTKRISGPSEGLEALIADMLETMHNAQGIGLAAPQVGRSEQLFVVDLTPALEEEEEPVNLPPQPMVFINPRILWESEEEIDFEEGCLSIPDIREMVVRPQRIRIAYQDQNFQKRLVKVGGVLARVIQHEYDHLEGVLFVDLISSFKRTMLKRRLREMARGHVSAEYPLAVQAGAVPTR